MDWISKVFSGSVGTLVSSVGDVADKFITTEDEKRGFKLEMEALLQRRDSELEETFRTEMSAKQAVMVAELQQGDVYTKRARPTLVYFGLFVIFFNFCFIPLVQLMQGAPDIQAFDLPEAFWYAWGGVVGTWSLGRSAERIGFRNRVTGIITGDGPKG